MTFDATGAAAATATLNSVLPVAGITVSSSANYTFSGSGSINGSGGLTKSGTGTLTINTVNDYTGATTINGGVLAVATLGDAGAPGSIGAASAAASNLVVNGGTLRLTGSQTNTNRSMTLGASGGTLDVSVSSSSLQISGVIGGTGRLTKAGAGTLMLASTNTYSGGTTIDGGTIYLAGSNANKNALGSGAVTINNGTLTMANVQNNDVCNWNLIVPAGMTGRLNADGRCALNGSLTGSGTFDYYSPYVRTDMKGNWSAFTGRINLVTDADGSEMRVTNSFGFGTAALNIGAESFVYYNVTNNTATFDIGELTGDATTGIGGGPTSGRTTTWRVGGRNTDATFGGSIVNSTGTTAITKNGTGIWTLTGASTHTGATTVSGGTLRIDGSTTGSNVTVQGGAALGGAGTITGNVTLQNGGLLEHGALGAAPLAIVGNLAFGTSAVVRPVAGTMLAPGQYTVLTYTGTLTGSPALSWQPPQGVTLEASFSTTTPGVIIMTLTSPPGTSNLVWTGSVNSVWDTATANWTDGAGSAVFSTNSIVSFTQAGNAAAPVSLSLDVEPVDVIVDAAQNYTFGGSGKIVGEASLTKSGAGRLYLGVAHTYTGGTILNGGTLETTTEEAMAGIGAGPVIFQGGILQQRENSSTYSVASYAMQVAAGQTGTLRCDSRIDLGGTLTGAGTFNVYAPWFRFKFSGDWSAFSGTINATTDADGGLFRISNTNGLPNASLNLADKVTALSFFNYSHTMPLGSLSGVAGSVLDGSVPDNNSPPAGTVVTWQIGGKNLDSTFAGVVKNGNGSSLTAMQKVGTGTLTLAGANTYTGPTTVTTGGLSVTGSLGNTATTVASTGSLGGSGSIAGAVTCHGTLAPGPSVGTLTLANGLTLSPSSVLDYELGSASDRVAVTGDLTLAGTLNVTAGPGFGAGSYTLISYTGSLSDEDGLALGTLPEGYEATINTSTAGQVRLVVVATNQPPQISVAASASPSNVTTTVTSLAVTATDDVGEGNLTYTWSSNGPTPVSFAPNGSNAAKNAIATFAAPGTYTLEVSVADAPGLTTTDTVEVTVTAMPAVIDITPSGATLAVHESRSFTATVSDQFGDAVSNPSVTWSATGGGTINSTGLYTATAAGGPWQVTATSGALTDTAPVTVTKAVATVTLEKLTVTYDGTPKPVGVSTTPAGLDVQLVYNGSSTPPVTPGTYPVSAVVVDENHTGAAADSLVIAPRTFDTWETANFTPAQIAAGESAQDADPDHDGLVNLAEFALGGHPYQFTPQPEVVRDGASMSITFQRPAWIGDVTCHAEAGPDFSSWENLSLEVLNPGSDPETVRATRTLPEPRPARQFLRLRFVK